LKASGCGSMVPSDGRLGGFAGDVPRVLDAFRSVNVDWMRIEGEEGQVTKLVTSGTLDLDKWLLDTQGLDQCAIQRWSGYAHTNLRLSPWLSTPDLRTSAL
jgi:hypothetical protein